MKKLSFVFLVYILLSSCVSSKLHYFGETPRHPGHYPPFTLKDSLKGYLDKYRSGYDVSFYDLNLSLDPEHKSIKGDVTINFRALANLQTLRIDLRKNLKIYQILFNGKALTFKRYEGAVYIALPDELDIARDYSIVVSYGGIPSVAKNPPWQGGMVWKKDKSGNQWIGVTCESEGSSIWFPCKDHLSDEPDSVRLHMTVPAGLQVISNGKLETHTSLPGKETWTWSTHYPINIYNITFYAGNYKHIADTLLTSNGILNLDYYVLPENTEKAKNHFRQVKDVINIYSAAFGPYPWIKEGYKLVESPFEGMEHQTAIAYGSGYEDLSWLGGDYIIVHESAHEWWGNAVSVSDFSDIWLQEGFATYSELVFAEKKKGYDTALMYSYYWLASTVKNKFPVVGPRDVSYWDYNDGDVYGKGALILHTIRNIINDSTQFFDILQTFYSEHAAGSHVTTSDFMKLLERKTGMNWDKFFEAYLYNRKVPVLKWYFGSYDFGKGTANSKPLPFVAAKWTNVPEGFSMPVTLNCKSSDNSETIDVSTKAKLFYIKKFSVCDELSCNRNRSYFTSVTGSDILYEAEPQPVPPDTRYNGVIANSPDCKPDTASIYTGSILK
jgi:aminopeptidase N